MKIVEFWLRLVWAVCRVSFEFGLFSFRFIFSRAPFFKSFFLHKKKASNKESPPLACPIALLIAFDGTDFDGYAKSIDKPLSVEATLHNALYNAGYLGKVPPPRLKSTRWSRAVCVGPRCSALGQVISLDLQVKSNLRCPTSGQFFLGSFVGELNNSLPSGLKLLSALQTTPEFRAAKAAKKYTFEYVFPCKALDVISPEDSAVSSSDWMDKETSFAEIATMKGTHDSLMVTRASSCTSMTSDLMKDLIKENVNPEIPEMLEMFDDELIPPAWGRLNLPKKEFSATRSDHFKSDHFRANRRIRRVKFNFAKMKQILQMFRGTHDHTLLLSGGATAALACKVVSNRFIRLNEGLTPAPTDTAAVSPKQRRYIKTIDWIDHQVISIPSESPREFGEWNFDQSGSEDFVKLTICSDIYSDFHIRKIVGLVLAGSTGIITPSAIPILLKDPSVEATPAGMPSPDSLIIPTAPEDGLILHSILLNPLLTSPTPTSPQGFTSRLIKALTSPEQPAEREANFTPRVASDPLLREWMAEESTSRTTAGKSSKMIDASFRSRDFEIHEEIREKILSSIGREEAQSKSMETWLSRLHQTAPAYPKPREVARLMNTGAASDNTPGFLMTARTENDDMCVYRMDTPEQHDVEVYSIGSSDDDVFVDQCSRAEKRRRGSLASTLRGLTKMDLQELELLFLRVHGWEPVLTGA